MPLSITRTEPSYESVPNQATVVSWPCQILPPCRVYFGPGYGWQRLPVKVLHFAAKATMERCESKTYVVMANASATHDTVSDLEILLTSNRVFGVDFYRGRCSQRGALTPDFGLGVAPVGLQFPSCAERRAGSWSVHCCISADLGMTRIRSTLSCRAAE